MVQEKCGAEKEVNISRGYVLNIEIVMVPVMRDGRSWTVHVICTGHLIYWWWRAMRTVEHRVDWFVEVDVEIACDTKCATDER